jgi:hypothetical protein
MTDGAMAATGAAAATANALKASGAIVHVESGDFEAILGKIESPLVVYAEGGIFSRKYHYLTSYKGLIFYTRTQAPLLLPPKAELITARKIWIPE